MADISALLKAALQSVEKTKATVNLGGTLVNMYAAPLTSNDLKILSRKHPNFMMQPTMEGMVDLIIAKVSGDDEQRMFTLEHKPDLMRLNTNIISGIFGDLFGEQMVAEGEEEQDVRKGKSKATN